MHIPLPTGNVHRVPLAPSIHDLHKLSAPSGHLLFVEQAVLFNQIRFHDSFPHQVTCRIHVQSITNIYIERRHGALTPGTLPSEVQRWREG